MKGILFIVNSILALLAGLPLSAQVKPVSGSPAFELQCSNRLYRFTPSFTILYNETDPQMALKPAGIAKVSYNVLTWKTNDSTKADFKQQKVSAAIAGDGFDDAILRSKAEQRTANIYGAGRPITLTATAARSVKDTLFFVFPASAQFTLQAYLLTSIKPYPVLRYQFTPSQKGFYSIGYTGAPAYSKTAVAAIWQPLIWQEKRIPELPFLTPAYMATLPTTLVNDGATTIGVLASPQYLPFQPLPLLANSQFGVTVLNKEGGLQPQVFAPIPGGYGSFMKAGSPFSFAIQLVTEPADIPETYEAIAKKVFGFRDYRHNDIASLNTVLDNITAYSLSQYAWFIDSLKGCAYSTDVPGAVKNVSSLNPLELAIVMNDSAMFEKRAYPLMEFMLSREKFLFSLDSTQKIQSPSRKLKGPIAPLSELAALYNVFGKTNSFYLPLAQKEFTGSRVRNMDDVERGGNWIDAMHLYKASDDKNYLEAAVKGATNYLQQRVNQPQATFDDPMQSSYFFWPTFTGHWIELLELFELTGDSTFLAAAQKGAREYTQFTWMAPAIPDTNITVNKGGKAPMYWYLQSKGHQQMYYPEEAAPAWRLSEVGLTPESSGTATGHRAIFMANYAPWMLRIGYLAKDSFLMNVAKASIIGRYRNFPGYHINTERTTAYEKYDFPLHAHKDQSVNSFHYNHILPMASMVLDYLVTDAEVRSSGSIRFPNEYIEGYAYLQNKLYGAQKGKFYTAKNAQLWMPAHLLRIDNPELNYIAARSGDTLLLAFTNQSAQAVTTRVTVNPSLAHLPIGASITSFIHPAKSSCTDSSFTITVPANGLQAIAIDKVKMNTTFQDKLLAALPDHTPDYATLKEGTTHAMLFKMGSYARRLYVYLEEDDNRWKQVQLNYIDEKGNRQLAIKSEYPFEFTLPVALDKPVRFSLLLTGTDGKEVTTETVLLGK